MDVNGRLYETDFYAWSVTQADALRAAARGASNEPIDWKNLAEEIEDLGKSARREPGSRLLVIIEHLLKLEHSLAVEPRVGWVETIDRERLSIEDLLEDSPSLRAELVRMIEKAGPRAARLATRALTVQGEAAAKLSPPGYSVAQILGDWFPQGA